MNPDPDIEVGHVRKDSVDMSIGRHRDDGGTLRHLNNTDIGDPGWLGNPYSLEKGYGREESIELFADDLAERLAEEPEFREALLDLQGKVLGCWCRTTGDDGPPCHGDVIRAAVVSLLED